MTPCLPLLPSRRASPPFGWYSFYRPTEGRRLSRPGWLVTYRNKVPPPEVEPGHVTHPSTNRAQRRLTSLIGTNDATTTPRPYCSVCFVDWGYKVECWDNRNTQPSVLMSKHQLINGLFYEQNEQTVTTYSSMNSTDRPHPRDSISSVKYYNIHQHKHQSSLVALLYTQPSHPLNFK